MLSRSQVPGEGHQGEELGLPQTRSLPMGPECFQRDGSPTPTLSGEAEGSWDQTLVEPTTAG